MNSKPFLEEETILKNRWMIIEHIASGGKGEIYLAKQKNLDRKVAVKIISRSFLEEMAAENKEDLDSEIERFRREVLIMGNLRHQNILQIYDFDEEEINGVKIEFLVMEYIQGATLKKTITKEGIKDEKEIIKWLEKYFIPILEGMEIIHDSGIIHRDLKPDNIMLDNGIPKITDFGLAGGKWFSGVTKSHHIAGTMPYMPEEQFLDLETTDSRADIYALGKILYEAVQGKMTKETGFVMKTAHLENPKIKFLKRLNKIIEQATEKNRNFRISSVKDFKEEIGKFVKDFRQKEARDISGLSKKTTTMKWKYSALIFFLLFILISVLHLKMNEKEAVPNKKIDEISKKKNLPKKGQKKIKGEDGATLLLVPEQEIVHMDPVSKEKKKIDVKEFYMEKTEVTNHQYVEFLNKNLKRIKVEKNVVYGKKNKIWLILGKVYSDYEPILYENDKFIISAPEIASNPVIRVTPYGAGEYALFYDRKLPTSIQWHSADSGRIYEEESFDTMMHSSNKEVKEKREIFPVLNSDENKYKIKGLNENAAEWVKDKNIHYILGRKKENKKFLEPVERKPWEAFKNVGFRTIKSFN